jgi:hypothetical protein
LYRYVINAANVTMLTGLTSKAPVVCFNALVDTFIQYVHHIVPCVSVFGRYPFHAEIIESSL